MNIDEKISEEAIFFMIQILSKYSINTINELCSKGFLIYDKWENGQPINPRLTLSGICFIKKYYNNANLNTIDKYTILAKRLQNLFPEGLYPNTKATTWKGSTQDIVDRLKLFEIKYNYFNAQEILKATTKYTKIFDTDKSYMMTLKNFILKPSPEGSTSTLMEFIQNNIDINKYTNLELL